MIYCGAHYQKDQNNIPDDLLKQRLCSGLCQWPFWTSTYKATSYGWHLCSQSLFNPVWAGFCLNPNMEIPSKSLAALICKFQSSLSLWHSTFQRYQAQHNFLELESSLDYHGIQHTQSFSSYLIDFLFVCSLAILSFPHLTVGMLRSQLSFLHELIPFIGFEASLQGSWHSSHLEVGSRYHSLEFA